MKNKFSLRLLLLPFSLLWGGANFISRMLYKIGLLKSAEFSIPVIGVGNLSMGGTGKTPHTMYLAYYLSQYMKVGIISRGYKRKKGGYQELTATSSAWEAGDEAVLTKRKLPHVVVSVSENRSLGIPAMLKSNDDIRAVIMDDAFQHRSVKPYLQILLSEFDDPFYQDFIFPAGNLREGRHSANNASAIIITKCSPDISAESMTNIESAIHKRWDIPVFFSTLEYFHPFNIFNPSERIDLANHSDVVLITGIAGADKLLSYLGQKVDTTHHLSFSDHYYFKNNDIARIKTVRDSYPTKDVIFLTTEKDAMRLELHKAFFIRNNIPVYALPIQVKFIKSNHEFHQFIQNALLEFKS